MLGVHGYRRVCTCTRTYTLLRLLQKMWDLGILRLVDRYDRFKKNPYAAEYAPSYDIYVYGELVVFKRTSFACVMCTFLYHLALTHKMRQHKY